MQKRNTLIFACLLCFLSSALFAQKKPTINKNISGLVKQVSAKKIEEYDRKLVSFGTRNLNSAQDDPKRGIGAARDWIFDEFQKISADCGGCLQVEKQIHLEEKGRRVPVAVKLTNVVATLKGTTDPERIYVVSGHYDSMCGDARDGDCDAAWCE